MSVEVPDWVPTVYYAEAEVECSLEQAWAVLIDYQSWNPTFASGATVRHVSGIAGAEGEVVEISKTLLDVTGEQLPVFFALTVKVVPHSHLCWYVYPKSQGEFRNFVDFGLRQTPGGVRFNIYYYEQNRLSGALLAKQRVEYQAMVDSTARAFKSFCASLRT